MRAGKTAPTLGAMADVPEHFDSVHWRVLYWVVDGGSLWNATGGLQEGIASGEYFVIFDTPPRDAARAAIRDVLRAGYASLHDEGGPLSLSAALAVVDDPATWEPRPEGYYAFASTPAGDEAFRVLDQRFGGDARHATEVARRRSAEFFERHPDFEAKRMQYFDDVARWIETGEGEEPQFPSYPDEPPPVDDDVPRGEWPPEERKG